MLRCSHNPSQIIARNLSDIDKVWFDPWSGIHAGTGVVLGLLDFKLEDSFFLAVLWEVIENSILGIYIWGFVGEAYSGDTIANIVTDIIFVTYFSLSKKCFGTKKSIIILCMCFMYYQIYYFHLKNLGETDILCKCLDCYSVCSHFHK